MTKKMKEIVIPREAALFWLDKRGFWHNEHEKFRHPKIISHFHSSIRKDKDGFHLFQVHPNYREKVYFPYEDTALFVFDIVKTENITLVLNTKKRIRLKPTKLFIRDDSLYMELGEDQVKFSENALVKIADMLVEEDDQLYIKVKGRKYRIHQLEQA